MSLRDALERQARACVKLGSPFTARILTLFAERLRPDTPLAERLLTWPGDLGPAAQSVPLRLAGSLHGLVLDGTAPDLAACYPPHEAPGDERLWQAIVAALAAHADRLDAWLDRPPQTNEVGRSAVLIGAGRWLAARIGLPMVLSELGASAGLNLFWDRYALTAEGRTFGPSDPVLTLGPDWTGPLPEDALPHVANRRGVDLTPLDPTIAQHRLRLCAYVWADQPERLARTRAALAAASPAVDAGDAADWLDGRLAKSHPGHLHLVYHTVAWQYFPAATQARAARSLHRAGADASEAAPLAWLGMETDGTDRGAGLTLRLWPGDHRLDLGRADFHGRWIDWQAPG